MGVSPGSYESIAWRLVLPAAAECTASVWFPTVTLLGHDVQLAALNILGAGLQGFFVSVGVTEASYRDAGPVGAVLPSVTSYVQGYFLSTFTSWAGMVGKASLFAHEGGSYHVGILYMLLCIVLGIVAHAAGGALARGVAALVGAPVNATERAKRPESPLASVVRIAFLMVITAFVIGTYVEVLKGIKDFEDSDVFVEDQGSLLTFMSAEHNQLLVAIAFSIAGAWTGNLMGDYIDGHTSSVGEEPTVARGTLACNVTFALAGLSLSAARLHHPRFGRSVLLQSFAGSFCGSASAFNGHATDATDLIGRKHAGWVAAFKNSLVNLVFSVVIFFIGCELEAHLAGRDALDVNRDGFVGVGEVLAAYL